MQEDKEKLLKALDLCYRLISFRLRTEKEIKDYLNKKREKYHLNDDIGEKVIKLLKEKNLINDREFVEWFVRSRVMRRQKSEWVMKSELLRHGVNKDIIEDFFFENPLDEIELAHVALSRRWLRWKELPKPIRFKKSASFLAARGFNFDLIKKTIAKFEEKS